LCGALIVFLTFVAREGIREHLKELIETQEGARNMLELRNQFEAVKNWEVILDQNVANLNNYIVAPETQKRLSFDESAQTAYILMKRRETLGLASSQLDMLDDLLERTKDVSSKQKAVLISARLEKVEREIDGRLAAIQTEQKPAAPLPSLDQIATDVNEIADRVGRLYVAAVDDAKKKRETYQTVYDQAGAVSIALYTLGWALGFVGKIFGGHEEPAAIEADV
jgi:hypothetical protein